MIFCNINSTVKYGVVRLIESFESQDINHKMRQHLYFCTISFVFFAEPCGVQQNKFCAPSKNIIKEKFNWKNSIGHGGLQICMTTKIFPLNVVYGHLFGSGLFYHH